MRQRLCALRPVKAIGSAMAELAIEVMRQHHETRAPSGIDQLIRPEVPGSLARCWIMIVHQDEATTKAMVLDVMMTMQCVL